MHLQYYTSKFCDGIDNKSPISEICYKNNGNTNLVFIIFHAEILKGWSSNVP